MAMIKRQEQKNYANIEGEKVVDRKNSKWGCAENSKKSGMSETKGE